MVGHDAVERREALGEVKETSPQLRLVGLPPRRLQTSLAEEHHPLPQLVPGEHVPTEAILLDEPIALLPQPGPVVVHDPCLEEREQPRMVPDLRGPVHVGAPLRFGQLAEPGKVAGVEPFLTQDGLHRHLHLRTLAPGDELVAFHHVQHQRHLRCDDRQGERHRGHRLGQLPHQVQLPGLVRDEELGDVRLETGFGQDPLHLLLPPLSASGPTRRYDTMKLHDRCSPTP